MKLPKHLLNITVDIKRGTETVTKGVVTFSWSTIATIKARISTIDTRAREKEDKKRLESRNDFRMYCEATVDIKPQDRVIHGTKIYEVLGLANPAMASHHLEVELQRIEK